ncbi:hypothetical protein [Streptomyces anulatus]
MRTSLIPALVGHVHSNLMLLGARVPLLPPTVVDRPARTRE